MAALRSTSFSSQLLPVVGQLERQLVGRVVLEHVEDEPLLDGLPHRIDVERRRQIVLARRSAGIGPRAEQLHRLGLRRRGERDERDARRRRPVQPSARPARRPC